MVFGHMIEGIFCLVLCNYFVSKRRSHKRRPHKLYRK